MNWPVTLIDWLDALAMIPLALSGGAVAMRRRMDFYGAMVLAVVTALGGGMLADVLIGRPPRALFSIWALPIAALSGLVAYWIGDRFSRWQKTILYLDAIGLGLYAIAGAQRGIGVGASLPGVVLLGVITGSGGGMLRDVLSGEIPYVLRKEIYALAAAGGALFYALAVRLVDAETVAGFTAAALVTVVRIAAIRLGLNAEGDALRRPPAVRS